jgi:hypothetical protein
MQMPCVQFRVRDLMFAAAAVALGCRFDWSVLRSPSPRTLVAPLTTLYLAWATFNVFRILASRWSRDGTAHPSGSRMARMSILIRFR